jgi:hypothetical protein
MTRSEIVQKLSESPVKSEWFTMPYENKRKIEWFHYEFACRLYKEIENSQIKTVRNWRKRYGEEQIAEFCAYYSKRMEPNMHEVLEGSSSSISCSVVYVRDYCHCNSKQENTGLAELAQQALSKIIDDCNECIINCLSEPGAYCALFDI